MIRTLIVLLVFCSIQIPFLYTEEHRVAVITGTSRGIGLASAKYLVEKGFTVYGTIRQVPPCAETDMLHFLPVDLKSEQAIHLAIQSILQKEGRIDVLINNAGYAIAGPVESLTQDEILEQMEINFFAPIRFIQAVLPSMRNRQTGHIINLLTRPPNR